MKIIADLHIHGKYSRGCSKDLQIKKLEYYAKIKGLNLLGTGDFTHPLWLKHLKEELYEDDSGILKTKNGFNFVLQTEVSNIYSHEGKLRKIHNIILAKNFDVVEQINELFSKKGKLESDGRPIFGSYSCIEMAEDLMSIDKDIEIIPAHCWTPWFSIFGSMSGFNSVEECFGEKSKYIHALETGMSSDPAMNWRLSKLDKYTLVSNSDSHSYWPWRIGRECNVFDIDLSYNALIKAIRTRKGFIETIEVDPGYGKYHFTGHRNCNVSMHPKEALKLKDICPKCGRKMTIGVLERVEELADRPEGFVPENAVPFRSLIPLSELISSVLKTGLMAKKTWEIYNQLIKQFDSEFNVLLNVEEKELKSVTDKNLVDAIIKNRNSSIRVKPGYDGVYGIPIFDEKIKDDFQKSNYKINKKQTDLSEFY